MYVYEKKPVKQTTQNHTQVLFTWLHKKFGKTKYNLNRIFLLKITCLSIFFFFGHSKAPFLPVMKLLFIDYSLFY